MKRLSFRWIRRPPPVATFRRSPLGSKAAFRTCCHCKPLIFLAGGHTTTPASPLTKPLTLPQNSKSCHSRLRGFATPGSFYVLAEEIGRAVLAMRLGKAPLWGVFARPEAAVAAGSRHVCLGSDSGGTFCQGSNDGKCTTTAVSVQKS